MTQSIEFQLAAECCGAAFPRSRPPKPRLAPIDWGRFAKIVRFHRIEGLVWHAISSGVIDPPESEREQLSLAAARIAAMNLRTIVDCQIIRDLFDAAGVPLLFLKGLTLGCLSYGNPALKQAVDVDILIDPADLRRSAGLLNELGYRLLLPRSTDADDRLGSWHRDWKESVWARSSPPLQLDLHTSVADNQFLLPRITVRAPTQEVDVGGGVRLPTLAGDELFAYLAVHGASSAWFRLKWISDVAALLDHCDGHKIERLFARSQELGAGRAAGQALLIADRLFGTLRACTSLRQALLDDRPTRRLSSIALRLLTRPPREPTGRMFGTVPIHRAQFLLMPDLRFKAAELSGQARRIFWRARL